MPVYSLATEKDGQLNMNICTYVSAVSMKPKLFMVAIDYHTQTFTNLEISTTAVLQILHTDQIKLVNQLGKKSGKNFNKYDYLEKKELLDNWNGNKILKGACGYLQLKQVGRKNVGGDHELFWFEVEKSKTNAEQGILMFQDLIEKGMIL
ncbi:MAG: flavin reductase [Ekhidna sp.]